MAYNNYQQVPFWDFVQAFNQNGAGVDHQQQQQPNMFGPPGPLGSHPPPPLPGAFPWGGPGFWGNHPFGYSGPGPRGGHGGRRGRHGRRDHSGSRSRSRTASPSGERPEGEAGEDHPNANASGDEQRRERHSHGGRRGCRQRGEAGEQHGSGDERGERHGHYGPRGFGGRGRGGHGHRGEWGGPHGHGRRGPPPPFGGPGGLGMGGFDLSGLFEAINSHPISQHPWAQVVRQYAEQAGVTAQQSAETLVPDEDSDNSFAPPVDVFSTESAYVLHIALPGAKKEDVGVNFDADKGMLNVAGVVYRQGDEEFLKTLRESERKVGVFDRSVKLPPAGEEKEEVDGDAITAKLEDGVLVVTVPKIEKEWTEVKKVDIA